MDVDDEDLMRRFLVGDVTEQERARVEQRFIDDESYFEELAAIEQEMMLSYQRGDLPARWREPFAVRLQESDATVRQMESLGAFRSALSQRSAVQTRATAPPRSGRWKMGHLRWRMALAGAAAVAIVAVWNVWPREDPAPSPSSPAPSRSERESGAIATFLLPDVTRGPAVAANAFRVPAGAEEIQLELTVPDREPRGVEATLRPVGGESVPVASKPDVRIDGDARAIVWRIPVRQIPPGDYIVTVRARTGESPPRTIATRTFSVVE